MAESPETLIQRQLDAYNARDIEAFMECWAEDCRYHAFPDQLLAEGAQAVRERHVLRFREPHLHGRLINRIVSGDFVVDQEVAEGKIVKAWFRMGQPRIVAVK